MSKEYKGYTVADVKESEKRKRFSVISHFAGMGGSSTGYRLAGGDVLAANEFMQAARDIYSKNYPHTLLMPEDIRKLTGEEILKRVGLKKGELDILDGSPPCAAFSAQNIQNRNKHWGKEKKYSSTTQRVDDLFYEFARILKEVQPKVFIAENVKGLTMSDAKDLLGSRTKSLAGFMDNVEHESVVDEDEPIVQTLRNCGYKVSFKVLNSADFGVPQKRERLIFIGVRNDLKIKPTFPKQLTKFNRFIAKDAIDHLLFNGSQFDLKPETAIYKNLKNHIPPLSTRTDISHICKQKGIKLYESAHDRGNWEHPYSTVLQGGHGVHSVVDRCEAIEEAKRAQTFPDDMDLLQPNIRTEYVSIEELKTIDPSDLANFSAGLASGDVDEILKIAKIDIPKDEKFFRLDYKEKTKRTDAIKASKSWEFVGRAVPPLMMKAIADHVYENILKKVE